MYSRFERQPSEPRIAWFQIALSGRCTNLEAGRLRQDLERFVRDKSLGVTMSHVQLGLIGLSGQITAAQSALVKSWLMARPEVVVIRSFYPAPTVILKEARRA